MKEVKLIIAILITTIMASCGSKADEQQISDELEPVKVEIKQEGEAYQIYRGGEPYAFNGAGLGGDIKSLKAHGGNSFRTWGVGNGRQTGKEVLDEALENGMTVTMCIWVSPERHEMDYDDAELVAEQFERIKKEVLEHKDHPALLMWCIGNELNLNYTNPKVYDAVNEISKWIHEVDPNHPTTTTLASMNAEVVKDVTRYAPDLDVLSVQVYGDLFALEEMIKASGWTKPLMVTEWGAIGHWEMASTEWGAPIEQNSTEKAATYLRGYKKSIQPFSDQIIGNYVFLWGQKQERTPTWYGLFLASGEETEAIDVMHYIWNGDWPENRAPKLNEMTLDGKNARDNIYLKPDTEYKAAVNTYDYEGDSLTYKWVILKESEATQEGGDREEIPEHIGTIESAYSSEIRLVTPTEEGPYRLFSDVFDGKGHAAHANIPFYVKK
jgi:hypothetical protein